MPTRRDNRPRRTCGKRPSWMLNRVLEVIDDDGKKIHVYVRKDGTITKNIPENVSLLKGDNWGRKRQKTGDRESESDSDSEEDIHDILLGMDSDDEPSDDSESDATDESEEESSSDDGTDSDTEDDFEFEEDSLENSEEEESEDGDYEHSESECSDSE